MSSNEGAQYYRAAKFPSDQTAGVAYFAIQDLLFHKPDADISVYRVKLHDVSHVAVVGDAPDQALAHKLDKALGDGESVDLADEVLCFLRQRRASQSKRGPWVEGHYRPGLGFRFGG